MNQCAEKIYKGAWAGSSLCTRKAGFGKDGLYCKQHSARHMDTSPVAIWFRAQDSDYSCRIEPVEVLEETTTSLIIKSGDRSYRQAKNGKWDVYFPTKEQALEHYRRQSIRYQRPKTPILPRERNEKMAILRTLDHRILTANIHLNDNSTHITFAGRVFRPSFDREYDPVYMEVKVKPVRALSVPVRRPKPTSPFKEVDETYSI